MPALRPTALRRYQAVLSIQKMLAVRARLYRAALADPEALVQGDEFLPRPVVIVAPTSQSARPASFRPEIGVDGETTRVLVQQIGAVDARWLGERCGHLSPEELWAVDEALMTVLGLG